jgi:diacylglycerol kinase (ATP)
MVGIMLKKWTDALNFAIEGVLHAARTERHVRFHLSFAGILLLFCFFLGIKKTEFILLAILATIVIVAEIFNSAIEATVDLLSPYKQETARIAKDVSAGAVLIAAWVSVILGYFILAPYIADIMTKGITIAKHSGSDITIGALIIILIIVIIVKAYLGKGHPLRGGMPSGHTALAFSIWVSLSMTYENYLVVSLVSFVAALTLAISRVYRKIHTPTEIIIGALLGSMVTYILFKIFY